MKIIKKTHRPKAIKPFKSLNEEARFWDSHDTSVLFNKPNTSLSRLPVIESEKEEILTIRIQRSVKEQIKNIAQSKGINSSTLSRMWLIEKLTQANTVE